MSTYTAPLASFLPRTPTPPSSSHSSVRSRSTTSSIASTPTQRHALARLEWAEMRAMEERKLQRGAARRFSVTGSLRESEPVHKPMRKLKPMSFEELAEFKTAQIINRGHSPRDFHTNLISIATPFVPSKAGPLPLSQRISHPTWM